MTAPGQGLGHHVGQEVPRPGGCPQLLAVQHPSQRRDHSHPIGLLVGPATRISQVRWLDRRDGPLHEGDDRRVPAERQPPREPGCQAGSGPSEGPAVSGISPSRERATAPPMATRRPMPATTSQPGRIRAPPWPRSRGSPPRRTGRGACAPPPGGRSRGRRRRAGPPRRRGLQGAGCDAHQAEAEAGQGARGTS